MPPDPFDREQFESYASTVDPKGMSNEALFAESMFLWRRLDAIASRVERPPPLHKRLFFVLGVVSILAGIPGLWYVPIGVSVIAFGIVMLASDTRSHFRQVRAAHTCDAARTRISRRFDAIQAEIKSRMAAGPTLAPGAPPPAAPAGPDLPEPGPAGPKPA